MGSDPFTLKLKLTNILVLEQEGWGGADAFNSNEYYDRAISPDTGEEQGRRNRAIKGRVEACAASYFAALTLCRTTIAMITKQRERGFARDLAQFPSTPTIRDFFVEFDYQEIRLNFGFSLVAVKSLLDALSMLLGLRLSQDLRGFNRAKQVIGGRVLNALRDASRTTLPGKDELLELITNHKTQWIDVLVQTRDRGVHKRGPGLEFINFWTVLKAGPNRPYGQDDISDPVLSNGETVESFLQGLLTLIEEFTLRFRDLTFPPEERKRNLERRR